MNAKHTPGPWKVLNFVEVVDGQFFPVAKTTPDLPHATRYENARLIAAAPIGHALAERVLECAGDCPRSVVDLARQFMAKATGEGA